MVADSDSKTQALWREGLAAVEKDSVMEFRKGFADLTPDEQTALLEKFAANEGTQTKGGLGVAIGVVGLGSAGQSDSSKRSESRIRFRIPMLLPDGSKRPQ